MGAHIDSFLHNVRPSQNLPISGEIRTSENQAFVSALGKPQMLTPH